MIGGASSRSVYPPALTGCTGREAVRSDMHSARLCTKSVRALRGRACFRPSNRGRPAAMRAAAGGVLESRAIAFQLEAWHLRPGRLLGQPTHVRGGIAVQRTPAGGERIGRRHILPPRNAMIRLRAGDPVVPVRFHPVRRRSGPCRGLASSRSALLSPRGQPPCFTTYRYFDVQAGIHYSSCFVIKCNSCLFMCSFLIYPLGLDL